MHAKEKKNAKENSKNTELVSKSKYVIPYKSKNVSKFIKLIRSNSIVGWSKVDLFDKKNIIFDSKNLTMTTKEIYSSHVYGMRYDAVFKSVNEALSLPSFQNPVSLNYLKENTLSISTRYTFNISDITLLAFDSGYAFLVFDICFPKMSLDQIADFNFVFTKALSNPVTRNDYKFINMDFEGIIHSLDKYCSLIELSSWYGYHLFYDCEPKTSDNFLYSAIARGIHSKDRGVYEPAKIEYERMKGAKWIGETQNIVSCVKIDSDEFITDIYPKHVMRSYFPIYLLLMHDKIMLQDMMFQIVKDSIDRKKLFSLKEQLLQAQLIYHHKNLSDEPNYCVFIEKVYQANDLDNLYKEVSKTINNVDEIEKSYSQSKLNFASICISLFGVICAVDATISIANNINGSTNTLMNSGILKIELVIITLLFISLIIRHFKKRT